MAVNLSPVAGAAAQFFDNSGNILTGGKLYTYDAGTTTPAVTYTTSSGVTAHPNPIILNAAGRVPDSGEIWLSDGVSYKFVLKDFNDVLIATYDNIVGINSNFVNFTGEEETQTATQGQTVFTLTTLTYQPSTNNLLVFVNGSKQVEGINFVETSSSIVTFVDGLNVGDVVDFCTATPINTSVMTAAQVSYNEGDVGAVNQSVESKLQEQVSVLDFGAIGDGVTDDRAAIAAAVAACRGKNLYFPKGQYLIDTDGGSITLEEITLSGEMVLDGASTVIDQGTVLNFTGTTNSPFLVRRGVTLDGLGFYYPDQVDSATPIVYPPTLDFDFTDGPVQFVYIQNNVVYNAYRFINMTSVNGEVGHIWITNNTIYGILTCIEISRNVEIIKILGNSFTFGHWLPATEAGCRGFTRANGSVLVIPYTDGFEFCDNLIFGYLYGLYFPTTNVCQLINVTSNLFDQVRFPFNALGTGNISGVQVTGNSFVAFNSQNTALQANAVRITTTGSLVIETLTFSGNTFSTTTEDHVIVSGTSGRTLTFSANSFVNWAAYKSSGNYAALNISGASTSAVVSGNQIVASNSFTSGILGSCSVLTLVGNTIGQCQAAITAAYNYCVSVGNQSYATVGSVSDNITALKLYSVGNYWDKASGGTTRTALLVRKNATQSTSGTTPAVQNFDVTTFDKGSNFSVNTFTTPQAGRYEFDFVITHNASGTAGDRFEFKILSSTGQALSYSYSMIADFNSISNSGLLELPANATVTLVITRVSGSGSLTTTSDGNYNYFCARLVE